MLSEIFRKEPPENEITQHNAFHSYQWKHDKGCFSFTADKNLIKFFDKITYLRKVVHYKVV